MIKRLLHYSLSRLYLLLLRSNIITSFVRKRVRPISEYRRLEDIVIAADEFEAWLAENTYRGEGSEDEYLCRLTGLGEDGTAELTKHLQALTDKLQPYRRLMKGKDKDEIRTVDIRS